MGNLPASFFSSAQVAAIGVEDAFPTAPNAVSSLPINHRPPVLDVRIVAILFRVILLGLAQRTSPRQRRWRRQGWGWDGKTTGRPPNGNVSASSRKLGERAGVAPEIFRRWVHRHVSGQRAADRDHGRRMRTDEQCPGRRRISIESIDYAV